MQPETTMKQKIEAMLATGATALSISKTLGCDKTYPYKVRKEMGYSTRTKKSTTGTHQYNGPEGLKSLLDEYDKACKTIDKVADYLLKENAELKTQVRQLNQIISDARRPVFSPAVSRALVVHGD